MATIWRGTKRGDEYETVEFVEFEGEKAGEVKEESEKVRQQTAVYRLEDGRIAVHVIRCLKEKEETHARVYFFTSVAAAWPEFGWELESVGLRPRRAIFHTFEGYD